MKTENEIEYDGEKWKFIGQGGFNRVFKHPTKDLVLKLAKNYDPNDSLLLQSLDECHRAAKVFNEINPGSNATVIDCEYGEYKRQAWISPYYESGQEPPTEDEIIDELINIYERSGRVVLDACVKGNFLKTKAGQVICIDVGMALKSEYFYDTQLSDDGLSQETQRRGSVDFRDYQLAIQDYDKKRFDDFSSEFPGIAKTLKALLYLQENRPDVTQVKTFFQAKPELVQNLAYAFDSNSTDLFEKEIPIDLEQLKASLLTYCTRYIHSRGHYEDNQFDSGMLMKSILNYDKTNSKVTKMKKLIGEIEGAQTFDELKNFIEVKKQDKSFIEKGIVFAGVDSCLRKCQAAINSFETIELHQQRKRSFDH